MEKNQEILDELQAISPFLATISRENVFTVPENYFENLHESVFEKLLTVEFDEVKLINKKPDMPDGYFDGLSNQIMQKVKELPSEQSTFDLRKIVGNENVFSVPPDYFNELPVAIMARISASKKQPAKVVSMRTSWMRVAAAAVVAAVIFMGAFFMINSGNNGGFSAINSKTVQDPAALKYNSEKKFDEGIASLSDEEIVNYLQQHGNILDNELLLKNTDVSEMPDQMEYLLDEEALSNYLNKINNKSLEKQ